MTTLQSILFIDKPSNLHTLNKEDEFLHDLRLNDMFKLISKDKEKFNIEEYFYMPWLSEDNIKYRNDIFKDLNDAQLVEHLDEFSHRIFNAVSNIKVSIKQLSLHSKNINNTIEKTMVLYAIGEYCDAIEEFMKRLRGFTLRSKGLNDFSQYVQRYRFDKEFVSIKKQAEEISTELESISYTMKIEGGSIKIRAFEHQIPYEEEVLKTFEKFVGKNNETTNKTEKNSSYNNHVEQMIADCVAVEFPETYKKVDEFVSKHINYVDKNIHTFSYEIQFYIATIEYYKNYCKDTLPTCYATFVKDKKDIQVNDGYDIYLATTMNVSSVITNDFYFSENKNVAVISGPNQGGKTTFARMIGQLHYLGKIGLPIPASSAKLCFTNDIFTLFEKEENILDQRGKLKDDLYRLKKIVDRSNKDSVVILNEVLSSTTIEDASHIAEKILQQLVDKDAFVVFVTFLEDVNLLSFSESYVSQVDPLDTSIRTFRIEKKAADNKAYAQSIAQKYSLTKEAIKEKIDANN